MDVPHVGWSLARMLRNKEGYQFECDKLILWGGGQNDNFPLHTFSMIPMLKDIISYTHFFIRNWFTRK